MITNKVRTAKRKLGVLINRLRIQTEVSLKKLAKECDVTDKVIFRLQSGVECQPQLIFKVLEVLKKKTTEVLEEIHGYLAIIYPATFKGPQFRSSVA